MIIQDNNPNYNSADLKPHSGIWLVIRNEKNEIFMLMHNKFNSWTIPLEKTDPDESVDDAILRSGKEEVGIEIDDYKIISENESTYFRNGIMMDIKCYLVGIKNYRNIPKNLEVEKHSDSGWKSEEFILDLKSELVAVQELQKYLKKTNT